MEMPDGIVRQSARKSAFHQVELY